MRLLKLISSKLKKKEKRIVDFYQDSIEKSGQDQIRQLVEKGLSFKVIVL
jgi:hypothetical protein